MKLSVTQTRIVVLAALAITATVSYQLGQIRSLPKERPVADQSKVKALEQDVLERLVAAAQQREIVSKLKSSGYSITYDYLSTPSSAPAPAVQRLVSQFGPDFVGKPFYIGTGNSANVELLPLLPSLQNIDFDDSGITDDDLFHLKEMPNLRVLFLNDTSISSHGLAHLANTPIEVLHLKNCPLDDSCVPYLSSMKSLKELYINGQISPAAVDQLKLALPNCDVQ